MGFAKGFILAIPLGIYFGERGLDFPITYYRRPDAWGYFKIDLRFIETMYRDATSLIKSSTSSL